jgi:benzoylformate decarboxylase
MQAHLPMLQSGTFYTMCSGGLGWSLPAAVGVALAKPGARVIALIGDGSAMYAIQALWSAAQGRLPITVLILNNRRYAALQDFAPVFGYPPGAHVAGTALPDLDFVALAAGHGVPGVRVAQADDLAGVLAAALRSAGPMLVEIVVA